MKKMTHTMERLQKIWCIALMAAYTLCAVGQNRSETIAIAIKAFEVGKYTAAYNALSTISSETERDPKVNFYYGASMVMRATNLTDAINRLQLAQLRGFMKNEAFYYIGRAYQLLNDYEKAIEAYEKYTKNATEGPLLPLANRYAADCAGAINIAGKIFKVKTAARTTTTKAEMLKAYHPSKENGTVCHNDDFFQSDIDPDGIMYMTERADAVYFSLPDDNGHEHLMKMEKLIGGWGEMSPLHGIAADGNDIMPVLMTDGTTLYFCSDRMGGMGGYDIYRTTFDTETRAFTPPVNMGVPFNSAFDDLLFVTDADSQRAWFASNRETHSPDSVIVYEIVWDESVIRSMAQTINEITEALAMSLDADAVQTQATEPDTQKEGRGRTTAMTRHDAFRFVVCDSLTYTQWEHFRSPKAARTFRYVLTATAERDSLTKRMAAERKAFMELPTVAERNQRLQTVLQIERQTYQLEDEIIEKREAARMEELQTIKTLVEKGEYRSLNSIEITHGASDIDWSIWLRPENFSLFSPLYFRDARRNTDEDLMDLFDETARRGVEEQDSLMAWTQVILMEAEHIDETAKKGETSIVIGTNGQQNSLSPEEAKSLCSDFRKAAAILTSRALDAKKTLYDKLYNSLLSQMEGYDVSELTNLHNRAQTLFRTVMKVDPAKVSPEKTETMLLMKRRGMIQYDKCLQRYAVHADGSFPLPKIGGTIREAVQEPTDIESAETAQKQQDNENLQNNSPKKESVEDAVETDIKTVAEPTEKPASETKEKPIAEPITKTADKYANVSAMVSSSKTIADTSVSQTEHAEKNTIAVILYRIQLGAFRSRPEAIGRLPQPELAEGVPLQGRDLIKYVYGWYASRNEAAADLPTVKKAGFTDAFVISALSKK